MLIHVSKSLLDGFVDKCMPRQQKTIEIGAGRGGGRLDSVRGRLCMELGGCINDS